MVPQSLADRFQDYFRRQVGWLDASLSEYELLLTELEGSAELPPERLAELIEQQMENTSRSSALASEFRALWNEYQSTGTLSAGERETLGPSVEQARMLASRLAQVHQDAAARMSEHLKRGKASYATLRKGLRMLRKYRLGGPRAGGGYVDRRV